ncbi:hypothetical protein GCM10017764_14990 [Sphingobacterium griseoflavum]|uniref:Uncharacterized protein n=2 Tax=Sphingobacterium griseoflavum TaxID=1474952 RepID=A0ABQ3HTH9_9SPHI|nr:hypothetical protein GCM10017764_14990 [Sphingobacterium griseoflavum]
MHLALIGLAAKLKTPALNYTAIGLGIVLMLVAFGYFAFKCIVQYKSLTEKKKEESES